MLALLFFSGVQKKAPTPAGRRKRYGVEVGDRLLIFNTRDEADDRARAALKDHTAAPEPKLIKVRTPPQPAATIHLPRLKAFAAAQRIDYAQLIAKRKYDQLIDLYHQLQRREEEEIAAVLLLL